MAAGEWDRLCFRAGNNANPPPLPDTFVGPYMVSADGTAIWGGTGNVITLEGVWSFGAVNGGGWNHRPQRAACGLQ